MNLGDVVMLKSGGPKMTVELNADGKVHCVWFEKAVLFRNTFTEAALKSIPY